MNCPYGSNFNSPSTSAGPYASLAHHHFYNRWRDYWNWPEYIPRPGPTAGLKAAITQKMKGKAA